MWIGPGVLLLWFYLHRNRFWSESTKMIDCRFGSNSMIEYRSLKPTYKPLIIMNFQMPRRSKKENDKARKKLKIRRFLRVYRKLTKVFPLFNGWRSDPGSATLKKILIRCSEKSRLSVDCHWYNLPRLWADVGQPKFLRHGIIFLRVLIIHEYTSKLFCHRVCRKIFLLYFFNKCFVWIKKVNKPIFSGLWAIWRIYNRVS